MITPRVLRTVALFAATTLSLPCLGQTIASMPFVDGFESGQLAPYWTVTTTAEGYAKVATTSNPLTGNYHLLMASNVDGIDSITEAVLAVDLAGQAGVILKFSQVEYGDEDDPEDGVWVSDDGVNWALVMNFKGTDGSSTSVYQSWTIDLDAVVIGAGMEFTSPFFVKFSWNDNFDIPTDGFGFDDISLRTVDYTTLHVFGGPAMNADYGRSMTGIDDINGDGFPDMAIGFPNWSFGQGRVDLRSGLDGSILGAITSGEFSGRFGSAMANVGDVDGDGSAELLIGGPLSDAGTFAAGSVYLYSPAKGQFLHKIYGSELVAGFGTSVAGCGDLDGDGAPDLLVGSPFADGGGLFDSGRITAFSSATGLELFHVDGKQANELFGTSIASSGDVNGDGIDDIIVGAPNRTLIPFLMDHVGGVEVLSGVDGALIEDFFGDELASGFGTAVLGVGDIDGDGLSDIGVGAPNALDGRGITRFFSPANFTVIETLEGKNLNEHFGFSLTHVGDLTGDGQGNIAIGSDADSFGSATVYRTSDLFPIFRFEPLLGGTGFGNTIAGAGDVNGDGLGDFMIGAPGESAGALAGSGIVRVVSTANKPVFESVDGVHSTLAGYLVLRGQSLLQNLQVEIDGVPHSSVFVSPVEAHVAVDPVVKGGFQDIRIYTDLGEASAEDVVARYPALTCSEGLPVNGSFDITLDNGGQGSYILAYSGQIYPSPAPFANFGWFYGLELNGVWVIEVGYLGLGESVAVVELFGPGATNLIGYEFYIQAWTTQVGLGLTGFSNTRKFELVE